MPTLKQKLLVKKVIENNGNVSKSMRDVGYSPATAENPGLVTRTKTYQELMQQYLPDDLISERHNDLLNKKKYVIIKKRNSSKVKVIKTDEIDTDAVKAGVDMAYKIKGSYAPEKQEHIIKSVQVVRYGDLPDERPTNITP